LAIVKHIVNRHRGQLVIESEEGSGTSVSVWLPQALARGAAAD
jgi:two-component system, OmpR family, phosphate regulon sensor histidine kinase PhoR